MRTEEGLKNAIAEITNQLKGHLPNYERGFLVLERKELRVELKQVQDSKVEKQS